VRPFEFDITCAVFEKADAEEGRERRIGGIVSTDHLDKQSEVLIQENLDLEPFLSDGFFNDNHSPDTGGGLVGYPEFAELRSLEKGHKGWYVEGYLLKGHPPADSLWSAAQALQKSGRSLGFSVEGQILERDAENPKIVRKAIVKEVAITRCPVNRNTSLGVLAKSLAAGNAVSDPGVAAGEGFPLRTENLEARPKKKKRKKRMRKSEAIALLQRINPAVTPQFAEAVVEYALRWHPAA
jgi:hypothetical protein